MKSFSAFSWRDRSMSLTGVVLLCALVLAASLEPFPSAFAQNPQSEQQNVMTVKIPALPMSPIEEAEKNGTALRISLKELTRLALQNNLDIAISDTNEALYQQKVIQSQGYYDPTITLSLSAGRSKSANTNITNQSTTTFNQRDSAIWNFGISQYIPTGGGITALFNSSRTDTNQTASLFTPQFQANTQLQFTQPLWRNRRTDQTRGNIKIVNLDLKTNDSKFKQGVTSTIASIQSLYWDLVGAIRDYEIKRQSVELARITVEQNKIKLGIGTAAPINVTEAQATQASREIDLIRAKEAIQSTENSLRNMISSDRNAEIWRQTIVPTESPDFKEYQGDLEKSIQAALQDRPELEQYDIQLQQNDITYQMQNNLKKWQFDVVGSLGANGTAGPQSFSANGTPKIPAQFVGGIFNAYKTVFSEGLITYSVGFSIQIPLRSRTVDSQLAQTQIARRQLMMNRTKTEQNIIVQVRNAVEALDTSRQRVETAKVSRQLAEEQLDGENKRYQAGMSQNFYILQRQADLAVSRGAELQALIAYKKAVINLQQAMYDLLEANDFEVAKSIGKGVPAFK
jgi:outer membrane protein TolC